MSEIIGGVNPVREALRARPENFVRLYLAENRGGQAIKELLDLARAAGVKIERIKPDLLDRLYGGQGHQGVAARVGPYAYFSLDEILARAGEPSCLVLILDGIEDPGNLGALIRSAEAAGAAGVIIPQDRAAAVTQAAIKASAGAAEFVPVTRVVNITRTLEELKTQDFWIIGCEAGAKDSLFDLDLNLRLGLVLGGEGRGLRRLVREKCDHLASIPLLGRVSSLNASAAGAVAMFEFVRQTQVAAGQKKAKS